MNPVPGNSLYFVARGDGSHVFSADLDAHNAAVKEFQLKRRADYRSSPAPIVVPTPGVDPVPPAQKPAVETAPESTGPEKSPPERVVPDEKAAEQKSPEQPAAVPETTPQAPDDAEQKGEPSPQ
jgi:UPF0755 protein